MGRAVHCSRVWCSVEVRVAFGREYRLRPRYKMHQKELSTIFLRMRYSGFHGTHSPREMIVVQVLRAFVPDRGYVCPQPAATLQPAGA
jgi:hypothetical protein